MIPACLSADGGEAIYVGTVLSCAVYAVRRRSGFDHRPAHVRERDPGPHYYWTPVVMISPNKSKAFRVQGGYGLRWTDRARDRCVRAIKKELRMFQRDLDRGEVVAL